METGSVETTIQLSGNKEDVGYYFPAHLRYGAYNMPDAPMAAKLNSVDIETLESITVVDRLPTGEAFKFDGLDNFEGHLKIHLADDGPGCHVVW